MSTRMSNLHLFMALLIVNCYGHYFRSNQTKKVNYCYVRSKEFCFVCVKQSAAWQVRTTYVLDKLGLFRETMLKRVDRLTCTAGQQEGNEDNTGHCKRLRRDAGVVNYLADNLNIFPSFADLYRTLLKPLGRNFSNENTFCVVWWSFRFADGYNLIMVVLCNRSGESIIYKDMNHLSSYSNSIYLKTQKKQI